MSEPLMGHLDDVGWRQFWGWAYNPEQPDVPIWLELVVDDGPPVRFLANMLRTDLAEAGYGQGRHGFQLNFPVALDPRRPHCVVVRRESDGRDLPGSPWHLPQAPAGGPDVRAAFEQVVSAEIEAAGSSSELAALTAFMVRQTDRLLQAACDVESGRRTRMLFRQRWAETIGDLPMQVETPDPRPLALFVGLDLPADAASLAMLEDLQALGLRVLVVAMRGLPAAGPSAELLAARDILVAGRPLHFSVEDVLRRHAPEFRAVVLHGAVAAACYALTARLHHPRARILAWLDEPGQDNQTGLAAQVLCDAVVTAAPEIAAELDRRIRGWPVHLVPADGGPAARLPPLAAALGMRPAASVAEG